MASAIMYATRSTTENQPDMRRWQELAAQTFLAGVPVMLPTGAVQEWDGTSIPGIVGITKENGANLTTTGVPKTYSVGTAAYQPLSAIIPAGAPLNDGRNGFETAIQSNIFHGQVGPAQTAIASDVGKQYGMTKDTDGHWYVDKSKATVGTNTVVTIVKVDNVSPIVGPVPADPRGVQFTFLPTVIVAAP